MATNALAFGLVLSMPFLSSSLLAIASRSSTHILSSSFTKCCPSQSLVWRAGLSFMVGQEAQEYISDARKVLNGKRYWQQQDTLYHHRGNLHAGDTREGEGGGRSSLQQVGWPVNPTGPTPFITTSLPFAIAIDPLFIHDPCDGWPKLPPFCSSLFLLL